MNKQMPAFKKKLLLFMAREGEPRPTKNEKLGIALLSYTGASASSYDEEFDKEIRRVRPDWFKNQNPAQKKAEFIRQAREGGPKPTRQLLNRFKYYCSSDPEFKRQIEELAPQWFDTCRNRQKRVIELAVRGAPKPTEGPLLKTLQNRNRSPKFAKAIECVRQDWCLKSSDIKKAKLLNMAARGDFRPTKDELGADLSNYTCAGSNAYDPEFTQDIKEIAPHWFKKIYKSSRKNKEDLLAMARSGEKKPMSNTRLGAALYRYTSKRSDQYDKEFTSAIRKINSLWIARRKKKAG